MNDDWTYVGASTSDGLATLTVVRPRWRLAVGGRRPRGEWEAALLDLRRDDQESILTWLHRNLTEGRAPVGDSARVRLLLDVSEPGTGDLLSRAVVVLDRNDMVVYTEQIPEIVQEPNYAAALEAAKKAL